MSWAGRLAWGAVLLTVLSGCAGKRPPAPPYPLPPGGARGTVFQRGGASWYGPGFQGKRTASGERFDQYAMTAAHRTLPFDTHVQVRNLANGRTAVVRINDRGPFVRGRIIDLSRRAARALDLERAGVGEVELRLLGKSAAPPAPPGEPEPPLRPVDPEAGLFDVQVGAFRDPANAERLRRLLGQTWPRVHVVRFEEFHRVRVGPFPNEEEAEQARTRLEGEGYDPFVVRHDTEEQQEPPA